MMKDLLIPICLTVCALAACAPVTQRPQVDDKAVAEEARKQSELALQDLAEDQTRLFRISYPILARGAVLCADDFHPAVGIRHGNVQSVPKEMRDAAVRVLGLTDELQVIQVAAGSPAARAGLQARDVILAVDGKAIHAGERASDHFAELFAEAAKARNAVELKLRRATAEMTLGVEHERACAYPVLLHSSDVINAFADGRQVIVTRGMLRFIRDDLELAVVIGHELAHNSMGHIRKQMGNQFLGTLLDVLAASRGVNTQGLFGSAAGAVFSKAFEAEADYVGLYFTARGGYEVDKAPNFWRRMAAANPGGIQQRGFGASHPSTPERFLALEKIVEEIRAKTVAGRTLAPEIKP